MVRDRSELRDVNQTLRERHLHCPSEEIALHKGVVDHFLAAVGAGNIQ